MEVGKVYQNQTTGVCLRILGASAQVLHVLSNTGKKSYMNVQDFVGYEEIQVYDHPKKYEYINNLYKAEAEEKKNRCEDKGFVGGNWLEQAHWFAFNRQDHWGFW